MLNALAPRPYRCSHVRSITGVGSQRQVQLVRLIRNRAVDGGI